MLLVPLLELALIVPMDLILLPLLEPALLKPLKVPVPESFLLLVMPPPLTVLLLPLQLKILNVNHVLPDLTVKPTDQLIV